jgi:glycosyltransferase involved in cell wall biosynthesis
MCIGCWEGESKRYRVFNIAEALEAEGYRVTTLPFADCSQIIERGWSAKSLVFFRSPYESHLGVQEAIDYCRANGTQIVFDIDDLVFDPSIVNEIHGYRLLDDAEKALYVDGVHKYRRLLLECDLVTVTTPALAREVLRLGKAVEIIPNGLNAAQIDRAQALAAASNPTDAPCRMGYFSGSKTHERDFAQAEAALLRLMETFPDWTLLVVGYLELSPAWDRFSHRVERQSFLPYLDMLSVLATCDINIAPLEVGDRFCEAKSELKYFEAALVQVPTVASATEPYKQAILQGQTGYLASNEIEWFEALSALILSPELRRAVGEQARISAVESFGVEATAKVAARVLIRNDAPQQGKLVEPAGTPTLAPTARRRLKIDWIIPELIIGGGGHRNILRAAHHLQSFGHDVALHFTGPVTQADELKGLIHRHFYPFEGLVKPYDGQFRLTDVIFATHWTTVDAAWRAKNRAREIMYFVQDYEPSFAPMGSEYVLAENTYRLGLYCITSGPWCEVVLKRDFGAEADHFKFPIDRSVYKKRPRNKANTNIVFFAKPEMPRRCFEIGAMALEHIHRARPDIEIIMFGSARAKDQKLNYPVTYLEMVPTIDDLSQMYANADLGIVFSTTNPSLVPFEMMASGCAVVDLRRPGNEVNYDHRSDIALLADPMPEHMAAEILALLTDNEELNRRRNNGLIFADSFPTEGEMARRIEHLICDRMALMGSRNEVL